MLFFPSAELIRPPYFGCANAVGAAVANVSGEVDTIEILEDRSLDDVLDSIKSQAMQKAVQAGAKAKSVKVVEVENLPVQVSCAGISVPFALEARAEARLFLRLPSTSPIKRRA